MATPFNAIVPQNLWSSSVNHRLGEMPLDFSNGCFSLIPIGGVSLNWSDRTLSSSTESFEITLSQFLCVIGCNGSRYAWILEEVIHCCRGFLLTRHGKALGVVKGCNVDLSTIVAPQGLDPSKQGVSVNLTAQSRVSQHPSIRFEPPPTSGVGEVPNRSLSCNFHSSPCSFCANLPVLG